MALSRISRRPAIRKASVSLSHRNHPDRQDRPPQEAEDATQQKHQTASNREAVKRRARSAFRDSIEQDRAIQKPYAPAGVEKMLRSVVRKESRAPQPVVVQKDTAAKSQYVSKKLNSTYNQAASELIQDENLDSSPSQRKQQRAIDDYQKSTRRNVNSILALKI